MRDKRFDQAVAQILKQDSRYPARAYDLMPAVIDYTARHPTPLEPGEAPRPHGHVTGRQLAIGFRDYLLSEFGPFAADLLDEMNIRTTDDIGNLVYNLISVGIFGKTKSDSLSDFHAVYNFTEAFRDYYAPLEN